MQNIRSRGFTLIELLVVIAIIGILSAVVLASLNSARSKGNDAAVKSNMSTIQVQAELYYDSNSSRYGSAAVAGVDCGGTFTANTMLADPTITSALAATKSANGAAALYCNLPATGASYAIATPLKTAGFWCLDSTGVARSTQGTGATPYTGLTGATGALTNNTDTTCN